MYIEPLGPENMHVGAHPSSRLGDISTGTAPHLDTPLAHKRRPLAYAAGIQGDAMSKPPETGQRRRTIPSASLAEYAQIVQHAWRSSLSIAELCRRHILRRRVIARVPQIDAEGIVLLRQLCGLIKQLWTSQNVKDSSLSSATWTLLSEAKRKLHLLTIGHD